MYPGKVFTGAPRWAQNVPYKTSLVNPPEVGHDGSQKLRGFGVFRID